jgi:release factor glutamine methyltransferase
MNPNRRRAVDVGTGSGCIAVTLCMEISDLEMFAMDISMKAIEIARRNALMHTAQKKIQFWVGDLLNGVVGEFDLICANLPYIPRRRLSSLSVAKREPLSALDGGEEGLDLIFTMMRAAENHLRIGGRMILEMDESHGKRVMDLATSIYPDWSTVVSKDLAGMDRILILDREL